MIKNFKVTSTSLVSAEGLQKTIINFLSDENRLLTAAFYVGGKAFGRSFSLKATAGEVSAQAMLPEAATEESAECVLYYEKGEEAARTAFLRKVPRKWNLYAMVSSHTDIGLHNSQYIQRANSVRFLQKAASLVDETADFPEEARYRYTVEGTWFFGNYPAEKGSAAAREIVEKYISKGDIGVCCGVAGNHVQTYGYEEMCISAYERKRLFDNWGVKSQTLSMIDNNGMPHSMIQPYAEAGYKNIIFAPNQWNPQPSTIVKRDESVWGYEWNPEARGGGSRIDVNYSSPLPMLFNWSDGEGHSLTVWCSTAYDWGGAAFGVRAFYPHFEKKEELEKVIRAIEEKTTIQLENLEKRYLYDLWFFACYGDDLEPNTGLSEVFREWNTRWKNPKFSTVGDPDPLFDEVRAKWGKAIPELKGDITGGWYQHPLTVPEIMSKKYEADRLLPIAEKWSSVACMLDENYLYPAEKFRRAWDALLFNDEHSYGTSGYQGRRVYETWIQHKDWVKKAFDAAAEEIERATKSIAAFVNTQVGDRLVFNPTNFERRELVEDGTGGYALCSIPPFGCKVVKKSEFERFENVQKTTTVPVIENDYYKITFSSCGGMVSIYDKVLKIELL
ncbi:MAG: hypothetical protein IJS67_04940, partial [Clostridia bacterium]|nr:hypothetical protein [Clostridia bacterium]